MKIFWSWQSDTDGKSGRHFIKEAITEAIKLLKSDDDVVEPEARDLQRKMHLDHDRKGVAGSPDLAKTIFDKIDSSAVFIGDVTPTSSLERVGESGVSETKKAMNGNVAIELGYALKSLGTERLLFVCNKHYGGREDLPFDLKHKSGPIFYELPPNADAAKFKVEKAALVSELKVALRAFLLAAPVKQETKVRFSEVAPSVNTGTFFEYFDDIVETTEEDIGDNMRYDFQPDSFFYLRLFPAFSIQKKFTKQELLQLMEYSKVSSFHRNKGGAYRVNRFGAVVFNLKSNAGRVDAVTQVFQSGELWGLTKNVLADPFGNGMVVGNELLEKVLWSTMESYMEFAKQHLKLGADFQCIFGGKGLGEVRLTTPHLGYNATRKFLQSSFEVRAEIGPHTIRQAYDAFRIALYDSAGQSTPKKDAAHPL